MSFHQDEFHQTEFWTIQKILIGLYEVEANSDDPTEHQVLNKIILMLQDLQARSQDR